MKDRSHIKTQRLLFLCFTCSIQRQDTVFVVRCTQRFVGVTKLWHCEEQGLNTLAGDGHAVGQEGKKDGEDGHWEQVDVWFGIKDLVQSC